MIRLLLDQGLPRSTVQALSDRGIEAAHAADLGMSTATDAEITKRAGNDGRIIVTLDADFHTLLALSGDASPSIIRIRREGLKGPEIAELIVQVMDRVGEPLRSGALVTVTEHSIRVHRLPVQRPSGAAPRFEEENSE